ncbi:MAG: NAD(P)-dependent alcohol dehydrogenase [Proteobacteria bacterium]|nr:NAD(P)-dependent alcohol dehydrogenase [Pseudomonadota bacterium]
MKIQAAVAPETGKPFQIQEVELEDPRSDEILVRIVGTGLCHTDLLFKDQMPIPLPAVYGHEGAGVVEKVGEKVSAVKPGDHVALSYNSCGKCNNCLKGMPFYCLNFMGLNYGGARGDGSMPLTKDGVPLYGCFFGQSSFATHSLVTERNAVKVPEDIPLEILGPLGCGFLTGAGTVINALKVRAGSSIAVYGTGAVGLSALMGAKAAGCTIIVGVDIVPSRLELAKELGATHTVNSAEDNPVEKIQAITGVGVNYTVETTAIPTVYRQALESLDPTGECVLLGAPPIGTEVTFDMQSLLTGKRTRGVIEGDSIPQQFIPEMIELYRQGLFPFEKLIKTYAMEDINQAVEDSEKGITIKPVILFGG